MAGSGGHDQILQAEHLRLLPDVPPTTVFGGRLVEEGHPEKRRELGRRRAPGVGLHRAAVVERRLAAAAVPVPPKVAVGAEEGRGGGAAEDGPGGAAVGAERGAGVAGADPVGAVHVAVARQAEPGGVGAAVDRRRRGAAVVAARRLRGGAVAGLRLARRGFLRPLLLHLLLLSWLRLQLLVSLGTHHALPLVLLLTHPVGSWTCELRWQAPPHWIARLSRRVRCGPRGETGPVSLPSLPWPALLGG